MSWGRWRTAIGLFLLAAIGTLTALPGDLEYCLLVLIAGPCVLACMVLADRPRVGLILYGLLAVALFGFFSWSQLGPGLHPAPPEWVVPFAIAGTVIALIAALVSVRPLPSGRPAETWALLGVIFVAGCCFGCLPAFAKGDDIGNNWPHDGLPASTQLWDVPGDDSDVRPAPPATTVTPGGCSSITAYGCFPFYVVAAADGVPRDVLLQRVVSHYAAHGWPLVHQIRAKHQVYYGCRPVRGILTYHDHCIEVFDEPDVGVSNAASDTPPEGTTVWLWEGDQTP